MLSKLRHSFSGIVRGEGLRGLLVRFNERRRKYFRFFTCYIFVYDIDLSVPLPRARAPVEVRRLDPADRPAVEALARMYQEPATPEGVLRRLSDQEHCYVAYFEDRPVSYIWYAFRPWVREYYNDTLKLAPDEIYVHDAYTVAELRGKNIYPLLKVYGAQDLARERGAKRVLMYVRIQNKASLSASRRMGDKRAGRYVYLRLFGRHISLIFRHRPRPL